MSQQRKKKQAARFDASLMSVAQKLYANVWSFLFKYFFGNKDTQLSSYM